MSAFRLADFLLQLYLDWLDHYLKKKYGETPYTLFNLFDAKTKLNSLPDAEL